MDLQLRCAVRDLFSRTHGRRNFRHGFRSEINGFSSGKWGTMQPNNALNEFLQQSSLLLLVDVLDLAAGMHC
jgi:hypothetical protein